MKKSPFKKFFHEMTYLKEKIKKFLNEKLTKNDEIAKETRLGARSNEYLIFKTRMKIHFVGA
jgi:hypothetical protein